MRRKGIFGFLSLGANLRGTNKAARHGKGAFPTKHKGATKEQRREKETSTIFSSK